MLMRVGHRSDRGALSDAGSTATITSRGCVCGCGDAIAEDAVSGSAGSSGCSRLAQSGHPVRRAGAFRLGSAGLGTSELGFIEIAVSDVPEPDNPCLAHFDPPTPDRRPGSRCIAGPWNCAPARRSCCTH